MSDKAMRVCMIAYAQYLCDARIKAYVRSIEQAGGSVDLFVLRENSGKKEEKTGNSHVYYLTRKYQGTNPIFYLLSYVAFFVTAFFHVSRMSLQKKYDAVHVHNMPNFIIFAALIPKLSGSQVILDVHDLMTVNYMTKFHVNHDNLLIKYLVVEQRISARMASRVLCADHMQKNYLEEVCKLPADKVTVIMNLPNEQIFKPMTRKTSGDKFRIVYHGTITKRLGIDIMLEAMAKIGDKIPAHLTIYGEGDFLAEALRLSEKLNLNGSVYFSKTFFPAEMIPEMVGNMDLGIIANRRSLATDKYMMPVKLLEYVYLKIPVVAPRLEIIRSYFDEGMLKYYEPENTDDLAKCIIELYNAPDERALFAKKAAKFYENHCWKTQAEEYLHLLSNGSR